MKKLIIAAFALLPFTSSFAQDDVYPAKEYKGLLFIKNGIVHVGNGQVLEGFPPDDLDHMAEGGAITMTCEFCNLDFRFARDEVQGQAGRG